jgi:uncharacterized protein (TIGR03083 family)
MTVDAHPEDLLGAYVVDGCASTAEVTTVSEHAAACPSCATEIDMLDRAAQRLAMASLREPAPVLRERVLTAALSARPAREPAVGRSLDPYVAQVAKLGQLLAGLTAAQWRLPTPGPHASVRELVGHLAANDGMVAADLDIPAVARPPAFASHPSTSTSDIRRHWREQADGLLREVSGAGPAVLDRSVRLAGKHRPGTPAPRRTLREALTQRTFETWIHADDVRTALRLPVEPPPPQTIAAIVDFGLRLLPGAMDAAGHGCPHQAVRLVLTGPGGGERQVALSATAPGAVVAEVTMPAERFCRLLAGRVPAAEAGAQTRGDPAAVAHILAVAVTMGCD